MEARNTGRKINKCWFVRQGRRVYGQLYPHRVTKASGRMTEYAEFKFFRLCDVGNMDQTPIAYEFLQG